MLPSYASPNVPPAALLEASPTEYIYFSISCERTRNQNGAPGRRSRPQDRRKTPRGPSLSSREARVRFGRVVAVRRLSLASAPKMLITPPSVDPGRELNGRSQQYHLWCFDVAGPVGPSSRASAF